MSKRPYSPVRLPASVTFSLLHLTIASGGDHVIVGLPILLGSMWLARHSKLIGLVAGIDGKTVQQRLAGAVQERVGGGVLAGLGILFFVRFIGVLVAALVGRTPVARVEVALHIADFMLAPSLVIGGVLLWRREALGYVSGMGLLFQTSMLFVGLIVILILQPIMTAAAFAPGDLLVVLVMGMVSFIPLALFVRGTAKR